VIYADFMANGMNDFAQQQASNLWIDVREN